jgi:hypothetical protein
VLEILKSFYNFSTSCQEDATHKNDGKKAEDQATESNQGPAVKSI